MAALRHSVHALRHRSFATFWVGALVSNCGTWMQNVTVPYVIYEESDSAALVGVTAFLQFIPALFFGPIGGWLADRHPRRSVLLITQAVQGVLALVLWATYWAWGAQPILMISLVFLSGVVQGLNIPSWQAFVTELVPRSSLLNAMTLNSAQFNAARAVGPAIAGLVLGKLGASWAFSFNAVSYLAVIGALMTIPRSTPGAVPTVTRGVFPQMRECLRFAMATRGIRAALVLLAVGAGLGQPVFQMMPIFADRVFHVEAWRFGLMAASLGTGGVVGAVVLGVVSARRSRGWIVKGALSGYGICLIVFAATSVYIVGIAALLVAGLFYISVQAPLNTSVQVQVPEHLRGGVLALYVMMFNIAYPLGALLQGLGAQAVGPQWTLGSCAAAIVLATLVARGRHAFSALDDELEHTVALPGQSHATGPTSV